MNFTSCVSVSEKFLLDLFFERYWQTDGYKSAGLGLGLAICKGIVDSHGGKIWLESKIGFGTSFYFSIPIDKTATTETERKDY